MTTTNTCTAFGCEHPTYAPRARMCVQHVAYAHPEMKTLNKTLQAVSLLNRLGYDVTLAATPGDIPATNALDLKPAHTLGFTWAV